jgi:hypothetical protein
LAIQKETVEALFIYKLGPKSVEAAGPMPEKSMESSELCQIAWREGRESIRSREVDHSEKVQMTRSIIGSVRL